MIKETGSLAKSNKKAPLDGKKMKTDDIVPASVVEESFLNKSSQCTYSKVQNVRFIPEAIEFTETIEAKQLAKKITIQNIGRYPIYIKIGEPNSFTFHVKKPIRRARFLGSGCSITREVFYNYNTDDLVQSSQIPIHINGQLVYYPLFVKKAEPKIELRPRQLDFGIIDLGMSAKAIQLTIFNKGKKRTKFEIDLKKNFLDLIANPVQGTVKPNDFVNVTVEMMGLKEGEFYQELWIKTKEVPIRVPVLVEIIRPRLEFAYPMGAENLVLISFRPTFIRTQRVESIVLRNHSVKDTLYIIFAEVNGEIQLLRNARNSTSSFKMFTLSSEEGHLKPFENRVLNVAFCPVAEVKKKGWHHEEYEKKNETNYKIENIYDNYTAKISSFNQSSTYKISNSSENMESAVMNAQSSDALRVCLLGEAIEPDILIEPLSFEFNDLSLGHTENKVLRITNNSPIPVKCKFCKICNVRISPKEVWLKNGKTQEFLVSLTPTYAGKIKTKMEVQILAESEVVSAKKTLETISVIPVTLVYKANDVPLVPPPKVGLGITPMITDEVGLQKELITFRDVSKLPYSAVLDLKQGFKPVWMKKEKGQEKNLDNAMIALPNDRPRSFYSWPKDKICRTIFKGFFRYSPPEDLTYTLSPEGKIERKERHAIWANYLSVLRELRSTKHIDSNDFKFHLKYDYLCCKRHYNMENNKPNLNFEPKTQTSKSFKMLLKQRDSFPLNTLVPLSPFFLFNVIVEPRLINFNTVINETVAQETITVNNINPFPIGIQFMSEKSTLWVTEKDIIIVRPSETKKVYVSLQVNNSGLHVGVLSYVINGNHKFQITTYANVNSKILVLESKEKLRNSCHAMSELSLNKSLESKKLLGLERTFGVYFIDRYIDLGDVPLNLPVKTKSRIRNAYYHDVCFEVICSMPGVMIEPQRGILKSRSFLPLDIKLHFPVIMKFYFEVIVIINSVEQILVEISGNVVLPNIKIKPPEIIMRKICAYSLEAFEICVENAGTTRAELSLDFKNWPEFRVANNQFKFYLPPKMSSNIVINFEPVDAARYVFYLPIIINNILGPPVIQDQETEFVYFYTSAFEDAYDCYGEIFSTRNSKLKIPFVFVSGTVTQSLIRLSTRNIQFQMDPNRELEAKNSREKLNLSFQPQDIEIFNDFADEVTFCIRNDDLGECNGSPFNLTPIPPDSVEYRLKSMKAQLKHGEKLVLRATFNPKKLGICSVNVPIFVKGYSEGLVYNYIYMRGELKPRIRSETTKVHFPSLPLDVECKRILTISAENYDAPDFISCLICDSEVGNNDQDQKYLTCTWLEEPRIAQSGTTYSFPLQIQFQSSVPIALRKYILLFDSMGDYVSISVTAVADNSNLSNHAFLVMKAFEYVLIRDEAFEFKKKSDEVLLEFPINKDDLQLQSQVTKTSKKRGNKAADFVSSKFNSSATILNDSNNSVSPKIDKGPRLIMQMANSMSRLNNLNNFKTAEKLQEGQKKSSSSPKIKSLNSQSTQNESINTSKTLPSSGFTGSRISSINFPFSDNSRQEYTEVTLKYIETWIYEVVMKCNQYLSIPQSFQCLREQTVATKSPGNKEAPAEVEAEKDFLDFLEEIVGKNQNLPKRPTLNKSDSPVNRAKALISFFAKILKLLESEGCLLPQVRPEFLIDYENYAAYSRICENVDFFYGKCKEPEGSSSLRFGKNQKNSDSWDKKLLYKTSSELSDEFWKNDLRYRMFLASDNDTQKPEEESLDEADTLKQQLTYLPAFLNGKVFKYKEEKLNKNAFESISTKAWVDTLIQIFRVFVLTKVVPKITIPQVLVVDKTDKIMTDGVDMAAIYNYGKNPKSKFLPLVDSYESNIHSVQERVLLSWLNHHLQAQKEILWESKSDSIFKEKILNNFDSDLSDSVALIALTASHCPYIVSDYFKNVFPKPDTPGELQSNAQKLIEAWKVLSIGFTVKVSDLVRPNSVFMIMLLTHLYEFLPALHPHSLICFSAPLNSEMTRSLVLKNESKKRIVYRKRFLGKHKELFQLKDDNFIELPQSKTINVRIKFTARKIKRAFATLVLSTISPTFAKPLAYYLEGEPSELPEHEKFIFNAPLYKVICAQVPVNPPYPEPVPYEIWYTTKRPQYERKEDIHSLFSPWSEICKSKVCRRLFLSKSEIRISEKKTSNNLDVTIACFTKQKRNFWLLFRSHISDFIILIEIKPKLLDSFTASGPIKAWSPSAECICRPKNKLMPSSCPFFTSIMIPRRNDALWDALRTMFFKTIRTNEKDFWAENFECNSGICLILWLLSPEEEEEVIDEFVQVLSTKVTYSLNLESDDENVIIPSEIEIPDVREKSDIALPIHLSQDTALPLNLRITMTSTNEKEIRMLNVHLEPSAAEECSASVNENPKIIDSMCQPVCVKDFLKPLKPQKKRRNTKLKSFESHKLTKLKKRV